MKRIRWSFKGIKKYFPKLTFEAWLKICKRREQYREYLIGVLSVDDIDELIEEIEGSA